MVFATFALIAFTTLLVRVVPEAVVKARLGVVADEAVNEGEDMLPAFSDPLTFRAPAMAELPPTSSATVGTAFDIPTNDPTCVIAGYPELPPPVLRGVPLIRYPVAFTCPPTESVCAGFGLLIPVLFPTTVIVL